MLYSPCGSMHGRKGFLARQQAGKCCRASKRRMTERQILKQIMQWRRCSKMHTQQMAGQSRISQLWKRLRGLLKQMVH